MSDPDFAADAAGLRDALDKMLQDLVAIGVDTLPDSLPQAGIGSRDALERLAPIILGGARRLGAETALAHMDPPTPWVTWATTLWNASLNQNLLHPDLAPVAMDVEARVINWIAPEFGMDGGHMTPGSTVSNLCALWAARELRGARRVVASKGAHLSVPKAAHLLGLDYLGINTTPSGALDLTGLPQDLSDAALVLTAGATSTGAVDPLALIGRAAWSHVDAAWAGPLRLSHRHGAVLDGIEAADSISISAHKWFFQPKESALVLFRETASAHNAISFGGAYLTTPNVGVLGSHGASAVPLLATFLALGREGIVERLERTMAVAERVHGALSRDSRVTVFGPVQTGVFLWRPLHTTPQEIRAHLPTEMASLTTVAGQDWLRHVAANPMADADVILSAFDRALERNL